MGGAWKTEQGEPLTQDLKGLVEITIEGPMTQEQVQSFNQELNRLVQQHGTFGKVTRKIRLKKETPV